MGGFQSHATRGAKKQTQQWSSPSQCVRKKCPRRSRHRSFQQHSSCYRCRPPGSSQPSGSGGKPGRRKPETCTPATGGPTENLKNDGKPPSPWYTACQKLPTPAPKTRASRRTYPCHDCTNATKSRGPKQGPRKPTAPRSSSLGQCKLLFLLRLRCCRMAHQPHMSPIPPPP